MQPLAYFVCSPFFPSRSIFKYPNQLSKFARHSSEGLLIVCMEP